MDLPLDLTNFSHYSRLMLTLEKFLTITEQACLLPIQEEESKLMNSSIKTTQLWTNTIQFLMVT